jgi:GNAT superfamily N-acetyltransferase
LRILDFGFWIADVVPPKFEASFSCGSNPLSLYDLAMPVLVRRSTDQDLPGAVSMLRDLYSELGEEAESLACISEELVADLGKKGTLIVIAELEGRVVGLATLTRTQAIYAGGEYGVIDEMYVVPEARSLGVGAILVESCLEEAKTRGWKRLDVTAPTEERWVRTVSFYEAQGFRFTGPKLKRDI